MTDKKQPEALRLANALEYCDASVARQAINELRRLHAELEALRAGYAAARLDIETLKAQLAAQQPGVAYAALPEPITYQIAVLKACEHGDALVGWRVEPSRQSFDASMRPKRKLYTEGDMHDFADRTHALRASHVQASSQAGEYPAQPCEISSKELACRMKRLAAEMDTVGSAMLTQAKSTGDADLRSAGWVLQDAAGALLAETKDKT